MKIAGTAVEGARDAWEDLAIMFASETQDEARKLMTLHSVSESLAALETPLAEASGHVAGYGAAAVSRRQEYEALSRSSPGPFAEGAGRNLAITLICIVTGIPLILVYGLGLLLIIGGVAWHVVSGNRVKAEATARANALQWMQQEGQTVDGHLAHWKNVLGLLTAQHAALAQQRAASGVHRRVMALGRLYLPFVPLDVAGYSVVVDGTGTTANTELRLPDLATNTDTMARVKGILNAARNPPILLRAAGDQPSAPDAIHGEESDLASAITDFGEMLESVPVVSAQTPLVRADAPVLSALRGPIGQKTLAGPVVRGDVDATNRALASVRKYTQTMRGLGKGIESTLRAVRDDMRDVLTRYGALRSEAVEQAHASLHSVLARSDLAYVTHYCPKCNRVPQYMFMRLGIDLDQAHTMHPNELLRALQENDEARQRLVSDEGLLSELAQLFTALDELHNAIGGWHAQHESDSAKVGVDMRAGQAREARLKALRSQELQLLEQFRSLLRKIVTGNPRPILELSRQARLHLDPETGSWHCPLCELDIDDPEIARMGRLLKIKDELLMPMWNALWVEKDDFRKSELFRTNEQIQRLVEKEVAALRDVAEQYRADMRPVRENLILATTEAISARSQLESAVGSLTALGVIDGKRASETLARLGTMTGGDLDNLKKRAEAKETLLNTEPQSQLSRRVMAIDPISVLMTPEQLFREQSSSSERPQLASGFEEVP